MNQSNEAILAYLAGFLDADGSIYVQLKKNVSYKYDFQVNYHVVFYQSKKSKQFMEYLGDSIGVGYMRERSDGIIEHIIGDRSSIELFLKKVIPFLVLKSDQAHLLLEILTEKDSVESSQDFLDLARKIDLFQTLNYSKKRTITSEIVEQVLREKGLLTP